MKPTYINGLNEMRHDFTCISVEPQYTADNKTQSSKPLIKKIPALIVGLALIIGGMTVYRLTKTDTFDSEVQVQTMPEIKTVTALGKLEPSGEINEIERGRVIAVLDSRDRLEAVLNQAQEQVKVAQANLNRIESAQYQQIAEAKATLNKIAEVRPVDIAVAEAEVRQAQAAVRVSQSELDRAYIKSPQAGTVIKTMVRPGEIVSSDEGIARIGQIKEMYAVAEVYESDISKVKLEQLVTVTSSAIDGKLQGTVAKIGLEIERQNVVNGDFIRRWMCLE